MNKNTKKNISIALQGGGAHGAFAWGALDYLLEDGRFHIEGISGTSAGGMNAASVIQGLNKGGNEEARKTLHTYWKSMSDLAHKLSPKLKTPLDRIFPSYNLNETMQYKMSQIVNQYISPYDMNPFNLNPFQDFLREFFDFETIRNSVDHKIFLGATHVKTGKIKIFTNQDISEKTLMASACLPFIFQTVEVDGEHYWDGGFIANPAIYPLIDNCQSKDIFVIQLTKSHCDEIPTSQHDITDRLKEITYNGCLVREMRAIYKISKMIDDGIIADGKMKRVHMHLIKNEDTFHNLNLSSALNTDWEFLTMLRDSGYETAKKWVFENYDNIGCDTPVENQAFKDFIS